MGALQLDFSAPYTLLVTDLLHLMHPEQALRSQQGKVRCFSFEFILQYS